MLWHHRRCFGARRIAEGARSALRKKVENCHYMGVGFEKQPPSGGFQLGMNYPPTDGTYVGLEGQ